MENVIEIDKFRVNLENQLKEIIKDSSYIEISKYIELLPGEPYNEFFIYENELYSFGMNYINIYFKAIGKLDKINNEESEKLKHQIYSLYLIGNYKVNFTYDEFITYSKLLNTTFSDYDPKKKREADKELFQSGDREIDDIVNSIAYHYRHKTHPHAYEISKFKLQILLDILGDKSNELLHNEFNNIDWSNQKIKEIANEHEIEYIERVFQSKLFKKTR